MGSFKPGDPAAVEALFDQIAPRYDLLNDLLSLGLHRVWKRQAVAWLQPRPGQKLLDLCCGTGDLALVLAPNVRPGGVVVGSMRPGHPCRWRRGALPASTGSTSIGSRGMPWLRACPQPALMGL